MTPLQHFEKPHPNCSGLLRMCNDHGKGLIKAWEFAHAHRKKIHTPFSMATIGALVVVAAVLCFISTLRAQPAENPHVWPFEDGILTVASVFACQCVS